MGWLEETIEPAIRREVKLLRDNGFNTECSCEHDMYVQCQWIIDGELQRLHNLLYNHGYNNYQIDARLEVIDGHSYPTFDVRFPKGVEYGRTS